MESVKDDSENNQTNDTKRKRNPSEDDVKNTKYVKRQPSPPSPPSNSCDREVSIILNQPPISPPAPYSTKSSLHTDLAITPSPATTEETNLSTNIQTAEDQSSSSKIVHPRFIKHTFSHSEADLTFSSLTSQSPLTSSPLISSPMYSPHSPSYSIPSPGSAFCAVSPRRRVSCDSEKAADYETVKSVGKPGEDKKDVEKEAAKFDVKEEDTKDNNETQDSIASESRENLKVDNKEICSGWKSD